MRLLAALTAAAIALLALKLRRDAAAWQRADAEDRDELVTAIRRYSTVPSSEFITLDEATAVWDGSYGYKEEDYLPSTYLGPMRDGGQL